MFKQINNPMDPEYVIIRKSREIWHFIPLPFNFLYCRSAVIEVCDHTYTLAHALIIQGTRFITRLQSKSSGIFVFILQFSIMLQKYFIN